MGRGHPLSGPGDRPSWTVQIHEAARQELLALSDDDFDRVETRLAALGREPTRPRPGMDIKKLKDVPGGGLYRIRVGDHRAIYATSSKDRIVQVLVVEDRELGYARMIQRAIARLRGG